MTQVLTFKMNSFLKTVNIICEGTGFYIEGGIYWWMKECEGACVRVRVWGCVCVCVFVSLIHCLLMQTIYKLSFRNKVHTDVSITLQIDGYAKICTGKYE